MVWIDSKFSPHPKARVGESVPVSETNRPTSTDNQSALLGIDSPELSGGKDSEKLSNAQGNVKNLKEKDGDNVNGAGRKVWYDGVEYSEGSVPARVTVSKAIVDKAVGKEYETVGSNGSRVVLKVLGYDAYGNVRVERTDYGKDGSREMSEQTFLSSRISDALSKKALVPVRSLDERLRAAAGRSLHAQRLIDTLDDAEKEGLLELIEASRRRGDAGRQDVEERLAELREAHYEDLLENTRSIRQNDVEKALNASGGYSERLRRLRKIYSPYEEASAMLDDALMDPVTIEEYAASFLGNVPKAGHGFIDHESLQHELGHGRMRIGGVSRGYGAYLAPKGEGKSINRLAHEMWESLPEILKDVRSDADCKNALLDVIGGAERPTDIANYVLRARMEAAEAAVRHEEELELEEHEAGRLSLKMDKMYERYVKEQGTVDEEGGLVLDAASQRSLSPHWAGALHALGRRIGRRIVVLSEEDAKSRFGDNAGEVNGFYDHDTLYLNEMVIDDEGLRSFVAGHELTHVLKTESPEVWRSYVDAVKAAMGDYYKIEFAHVREEYDLFYDEYNKLHPESPLKKLSDSAIEEEVCANWAGDHVLTDEASVRRIVESAEAAGADPVALTSRILDWIKDTLGGLRSAFGRGEDVVDEIDAMERARKLWQGMYNVAAARKNAKVKPVGKGEFGNIYDQFKGKPKEAVDFLLENKSGDLLGVFHRDGFGDIDLAWGNKDDNAGLEHIISKHVGRNKDFADTDELSQTMDDVIKNGGVIREKWDKAIFEKDGKRVVVRKNLRDKEGNIIEENKNWVVTSYDKEVPLKKKQDSASTLATPESDKGGRAVTSESVSEGKDSENASKLQEKVEKNAVQGIDGYDADEVLDAVRGDIESKLSDAGIEGVSIKGMALHGSRMRGDAREDSDLDVVVEYEGDISEDGLFNILNEEPIVIEGVTVDVNPVTKGKSGTLEEYMKRSRKYDEGKRTPSPALPEGRGTFRERLAQAVSETAAAPTEGQKEAGNYRKGHLQFGGYNFTVENPKGSVRSGKDASGKPWSVRMHNTYGYLTGKGHLGKDGDHLDVFINDDADLDNFGGKIYIVDQVNADGSFDEHKIMWGFASEVDAIRNYLLNYSRPWHGLGNITGVDKATFDKWVASSGRKVKPFAETRFGDSRDVVSKVLDAATSIPEPGSPTRSLIPEPGSPTRSLSRQSGQEGNGERFSVPFAKEQEYIKEKDVQNIVIDSAKERLPKTRTEALAAIPQGGVLYHNDDQSVEIRVGKKSLRHSNLHDNDDICKAFGKIGEIIRNAVKIGEEAPKADEKGHTHSVSIYYVPVNIDGAQYSARMVVKQYENKDNVLDEFSLYNIAMHKEKATPHTNLNATGGSGVQYDTALSAYKVKELIHSTQENDQKLLGIDANSTKFSLGGKEPFYSPAERAVRDIKQEKATPEQWLKMIEKSGGLKAGEDKWLGLSEWLTQRKTAGHGGSITKQEVLDFIRENQIQVEEVNYSEGMPKEAQDKLDAFNQEFEELIWEGGEKTGSVFASDWVNYAYEEMVSRYGDDFRDAFDIGEGSGTDSKLTPSLDYYDNLSGAARYFLDMVGDNLPINSTRLKYTTDFLQNKKEIALTVPTIESWNEGDEVHFGDAGEGRAVAWIRFGETTDKDGKKVLVIDEIQSKRHQEGREKGYIDAETKAKVERYKYLDNKLGIGFGLPNNEYEELQELRSQGISRFAFESIDAVPDAPFEKNWHELAMKRMLRYAAEHGYDKVAWTKGEQQAERYNIGNVVDKVISYDYPAVADSDGRNTKKIEVRLKNGETMAIRVDQNGKVIEGRGDTEGKNLSDVVGKDLAKRIMGGEGKDGTMWDANRDIPAKIIEGEGLRIGGEGMKGFYDQMLPRFMDKYGKKWGVKTGEVELPDIGDKGLTMHSVDVTPEMKESVMQGQPMFALGDHTRTFKERQREAERNRGTVMPGLNDAKVKVVDVPRHGFTGTGKQAIEKARIWANENLVGTHTAHQIGNKFDYSIDEDAVKKFLSSSSTLNSDNLGVHLAVLTELPRVIDESVEVEEHPDYKKLNRERKIENGIDDPNLLVHRMYGAINIGGNIYRVKTTMHEQYGKGNAPHDYRVTKVELLISGSPTSNALSNSTGVGTPNSELEAYPLAKLLKDVEKSYDSGKKLLDESEKVSESGFERAATSSQQRGHDGLDVNESGDTLAGMEQGFEQFSIVRRPTNHQRNVSAEQRMEERRLEQAKAAALDAGVREPLRDDYESRAHREWLAAHRAWEQSPDASEEPNEWDFEHRMQQEYDRARREYEEKLQQYMPERSDELTAADVIEERERMVHTPAQRQTNKIVDVMASERDPLSAKDRGETPDEMAAKMQELKERNLQRLNDENVKSLVKMRAERVIGEIDEYGVPYSLSAVTTTRCGSKKLLNVGITTSCFTDNYWDLTGDTPAVWTVDDTIRDCVSARDCFNIISFDVSEKAIYMLRIGADINDRFVKRDYVRLSYAH